MKLIWTDSNTVKVYGGSLEMIHVLQNLGYKINPEFSWNQEYVLLEKGK